MLKLRCALVLLLSCLALPCWAANSASGDKKSLTYRWVDENGVVHYGDRVPPQNSQKESTILNREGVQVGKLDAQKTPEQLAEEARQQEIVLKQKQHDAFL